MRKRLNLDGKKFVVTTALTLVLAVTGCSQTKPAATEAATEATTEDLIAAEAAIEATTEAAAEVATEVAAEAATEAAAEEATKGTTEKPAEEAAKGTTEKPAEEATTGATEKPAEEATTGATEKPAEEAAKGTTEKPAEEAAKGTTEKPAEETAKGATEKPAEETTKGTTEKPAEEATKGATEKPAEETTTPKTDKEIEEDLLNALQYNVGGEIRVPEEEKDQAEVKAANEAATEATTAQAEEAKKGSTEAAKAKQEAKKDKTDNPDQNVDSQGDAFAFAGTDGEFVENPSAPEGYSNSGITETEDGEYTSANEGKKNTSKDTKEASEHIKQVYAVYDEEIPKLLDSKPEQAGKELYTMITKGLDFLFFGKDFDGYTKDQVDEQTIIDLIVEMDNYGNNVTEFEVFGIYIELEPKYAEALKYIEMSKTDSSIVDKFDQIGKEILKEYSPEKETEASLGTAFALRA